MSQKAWASGWVRSKIRPSLDGEEPGSRITVGGDVTETDNTEPLPCDALGNTSVRSEHPAQGGGVDASSGVVPAFATRCLL